MVGGGIGAIAQLGERLLCKQEVTGSIPVGSTTAGAKAGPGARAGENDERVEERREQDSLLFWLLRKLD